MANNQDRKQGQKQSHDQQDEGNSNLLTEICREVGETKQNVKNIDKKLDNHISGTREELKKIHEQDEKQNKILDEHIAGVNNLRELYKQHREEAQEQIKLLRKNLEEQKKEHSSRISAIEKPINNVKNTAKLALKVTIWLSAASTIATFIFYLMGS